MTDNYDRLLTRVYDKQEKKMLYPENSFGHIEYRKKLFYRGLSDTGIICCYFNTNNKGLIQEILTIIPFKDRFVPMQCSGRRDQNKKPIYTADIVKICDGIDCSYHEIVRDYDYPAFDIFPILYDDCNSLQAALTELFVEVVGNKFENKEIYDQIKQ